MEARREKLFKKFTEKSLENEKCTDWFPLKESIRETRTVRPYLELRATSTRLYRSPLYAMWRLLNEKPAVENDPGDLSGIFNEP